MMPLLQIKTNYCEVYDKFINTPLNGENKETYLEDIQKDLPRMHCFADDLEQLKQMLGLLKKTSHLKKYIFTQGDFCSGVFNLTLIASSKKRHTPYKDTFLNHHDISFCYQDDEGHLCGFCLAYLPCDDNPYVVSIIRDVNAEVENRQVLIIADEVFGENEVLQKNVFAEIKKTPIPAKNVQDEVKAFLNCQQLQDRLLSIFSENGIDKQKFDEADAFFKENRQRLIDERSASLTKQVSEWLDKKETLEDLTSLENQIKENLKNISAHINFDGSQYDTPVWQKIILLKKYYQELETHLILSKQLKINLLFASLALGLCVTGILITTGVIHPFGLELACVLVKNMAIFVTALIGATSLWFARKAYENYEPCPENPFDEIKNRSCKGL
jgi:hypothetical protein